MTSVKKIILSAPADLLPVSGNVFDPKAICYGDDVLFIKLTPQPDNQYSLSRVFSLYTLPQELETVLQILKRLGSAIAPSA